MREGALEVVNVCSIVKAGCNVAISMEPLRYLYAISSTYKQTLSGIHTRLQTFCSQLMAQEL